MYDKIHYKLKKKKVCALADSIATVLFPGLADRTLVI